jgi:asparagine synthetase B (glutamine-hydrolysing)
VISQRKKHGFEVPIDKWLRGELREKMNDLFTADSLNQVPFLNQHIVQNLWRTFLNDPRGSILAKKIWLLASIIQWHRNHLNHFGFFQNNNRKIIIEHR